jgi:hypothetical protein
LVPKKCACFSDSHDKATNLIKVKLFITFVSNIALVENLYSMLVFVFVVVVALTAKTLTQRFLLSGDTYLPADTPPAPLDLSSTKP